MKLLNRYIFRTIIAAVLMVLLVICSLEFLAKIIDELDNLKRQYTFFEVLIYAGLNIPLSVYKYMPFAALVGGLLGLGGLATASELVIMRAAGLSFLRIIIAVIKPIMVLIALTLLLAEYVIPTAEHYAEHRRASALYGVKTALSSQSGLWNREGNEFMYFNSVQVNGKLLGVTRYRFDDKGKLLASSFAQSAIYTDGQWQEEDVTEVVLSEVQAQRRHYTLRSWDSELSPALLSVLVQDSDNLSISKLHHYIAYLDQQGIESDRYQLSFWSKVLQPLAIISLVLIAASFVFGPLREVTMGYRIFIGVVFGIVFQLTQKLLGPTSLVYGFAPVIAVLIPILACFLLGLFLLARNR